MTCVPALLGSFSRGAATQREGDRWLQQMSSLKLCLEFSLLALWAGMLITKGLGEGVLLDTQILFYSYCGAGEGKEEQRMPGPSHFPFIVRSQSV